MDPFWLLYMGFFSKKNKPEGSLKPFSWPEQAKKTQKSFYVANSSFRYLADEDSEEVEVIEQDEEEYEEQGQYEEEPDVAENEPAQDEPEQEQRELEQEAQEPEEAEEVKETVQEEEEQPEPEPEPETNETQEEESEWGKPTGGGWGSSPQEEAVEPIVEEHHHHQPTPPSPPPAVKEIVYDHPPSNWAERAARAKPAKATPQVVSAPNPNAKPVAQHQQPREPKRAPRKPVPPGASIFVGKLPKDITEEELRSVFSNYGTVLQIQVLLEKNVAFVDFDSADAVRKIDSVKGTIKIRDSLPIIQEKKDKENTQPTKKNNDSPARPKVQKTEANGWTSVAKPTKEVTKPAEIKKAEAAQPTPAAPTKTETKPTPPARGRGQGRGRGRGRGSDWIQG
eukprot:NODE_2016_length_1717_cov_68.882058_g1721_i0.p1 GENE.NODE_2016_length_1717_cov_68.882058_g1721_i0~~NODE_2016_length_1717_cov_68.882058_g1721_i0.p1  ORF type:complete len:395 (-),score=138.32 NODE_2016_length_1717_cov_68.882058_g1721_i0:230-1414(-)